MKHFRILGLMLFAVFALGATTASSAFAESEWLLNSEPLTTEKPAMAPGEVLLEDMALPIKIDVLCVGSFDGTVGPGKFGLITSVLNATGGEELLADGTPAIDCLVHEGTCENAEGAEHLLLVDALNLPLLTEIMLIGTVFFDLILSSGLGLPTYDVECTVLGVKVNVSCNGEPGATMTNETGGVNGVFEENEERNPAGECNGSAKAALLAGTGLVSSTAGTLSVS